MLSKKILSPILAITLLIPSMGFANYFTKGLKYGASLGAISATLQTLPVILIKGREKNLSAIEKLSLSASVATLGAWHGAINGGIIGFLADLCYPEQPNQQK